ncbi:MAG: hypothetical protein HPY66_0578 [Firmicutes bacterium]|nr:hypothetical protein [Bacillota bacterium]
MTDIFLIELKQGLQNLKRAEKGNGAIDNILYVNNSTPLDTVSLTLV